jgi:aminoglycoside 6-adenylyltransferase
MDILLKIINWVKLEPSIRTIILTGSRAEKTITDDFSDYDINIFCDDIYPYVQEDQWISSIENIVVHISEKRSFNNKLCPTRLVIFKTGIKVDFTFLTTKVLSDLVNAKSLPDEFNMGYKVAVGTPITRSPPHRSGHAELPHTAPTSSIWRRSVFQDGNP